MQRVLLLAIMTLSLALGLVIGCDDDDDNDDMILVTDIDVDMDTDTDADGDADCGPEDLCGRSMDECGVTSMTMESCLDWYETGTCADMDTYIECNCDCVEEATCDDYMACGEICFQDHC